jgi:hypothetical protein
VKQLKALGTAIFLVVALTVTAGAGSAFASGFEANDPATGKGDYPAMVNAAGAFQTLSFEAGPAIQCYSQFSSGLQRASSSLPVTLACPPNFHVKSFATNGCAFSFRPGAEVSAGKFAGTVGVQGPGCTAITLETSSPTCKISIPAQAGTAGVTYQNIGGSTDKVAISVGSYFAFNSEGGMGCPSKGAHNGAYWSGGWTVSGSNLAGAPLDLLTAGAIGSGLHEEAGVFNAETYPLSVAGTGDETTFEGGLGFAPISCSSVSYTSQLAEASPALTLSPAFVNCKDSLGRPATVSVNGCSFDAQGSGSGGVCLGGSKGIEFAMAPAGLVGACTVVITPQSGLMGIVYSNIGSGDSAGVSVGMSLGSVSFTSSGGALNCGVKNGAHSNGSYTSSFKLLGEL